jgi:DNA-binding response OmpR family regulator
VLESQQENVQLPEDAAFARQILLGAMEEAIEQDLPHAIAAAARGLRKVPPDERVLLSQAPAESPLVAALMHPNRKVRWEALATIMAIDPANPYPGASRVMQTLANFIQAGGRPRAVVAAPLLEKAQTIAAAVSAHGYDVDLATTGREANLAAAARGGADLVLVDARINQPELREVLYQLRAHPASSGARVAIVGTGRGLEQGRNVANDHQTALAFPYPQDEGDVAAIIERLQRSTANELAAGSLPDREAMSRQALAWLGAIAARDVSLYDVRKFEPIVLQATSRIEQAAEGAGILASFPSHESQLRLVDLANSRALPIAARSKVAEAFRASVERFGVQLTSSEVLAQYDRYNASETADRATQDVLAHVLDSIEAGRKGL